MSYLLGDLSRLLASGRSLSQSASALSFLQVEEHLAYCSWMSCAMCNRRTAKRCDTYGCFSHDD